MNFLVLTTGEFFLFIIVGALLLTLLWLAAIRSTMSGEDFEIVDKMPDCDVCKARLAVYRSRQKPWPYMCEPCHNLYGPDPLSLLVGFGRWRGRGIVLVLRDTEEYRWLTEEPRRIRNESRSK